MSEHIEIQKFELREGEELHGFIDEVLKALARHRKKADRSLALRGIFKGHVVARDVESGRFYQVAMSRGDNGEIELGDAAEVRQVWVPVRREEKAVWSTAYVNNLPDSAFLYIAPGGKKDEQGKTVPRALRYFPVRDADGKVDLPHLRNALARIPQAKIPQAAKDKATATARRMLEEAQKTEKVEKSELLGADEMVEAVLDAAELGAPEYVEKSEKKPGLWEGVLR